MRDTPLTFYLRQFAWLLLAAILLIGVFELTPLDTWVSDQLFDPVTKHFPLQDAWFLETVMHQWVKQALLLWGAWLLVRIVLPKKSSPDWQYQRRTRQFLLAALIMAPSVVGIMKHYSDRPCPWDSTRYGGKISHILLWESLPAGEQPGRCFPGGHSSGGFATLALVLVARRRSMKAAWLTFAACFSLGMLMGAGQVLRGAHYVSHNFWSAWVAWGVILLLHAAFFARRDQYIDQQV